MKKQIKDFVFAITGIMPKYSGKNKTMYCPESTHESILSKFGYNIPFKLSIL